MKEPTHHYINSAMQYTVIFTAVNISENCDFLFNFCQNNRLLCICSDEYPQSILKSKYKKNSVQYIPVKSSFTV